MQTNTNYHTSTQIIAKLILAGKLATIGEGAVRLPITGNNAIRTTKLGWDFDKGMSASVLNAAVTMLAGVYERIDGYMYVPAKDAPESVNDLVTGASVLISKGHYAVGCAELRNEVAQGTYNYDGVVVNGAVYKVVKEARSLKLFRLTQVWKNNGEFMSEDYKHMVHARVLVEGMEIIHGVMEDGTNMTISYGNSKFVADDFIAALNSADPKAAAREILRKKYEKGIANSRTESAMYTLAHADKNEKYAARAAKFNCVTIKNENGEEVTAADMVGKKINLFVKDDPSRTAFFYGDQPVDSIEMAAALLVGVNINKYVIYFVG